MCSVLIIEDDAIAAADIHDVLKRAGGTTFRFAVTEADAVRAALAECPAVITSDVMLSSGSGPAAVRTILELCGPRPIIFITATPDQCEGFHGAVIMEKPFHTVHLTEAFRSLAPA